MEKNIEIRIKTRFYNTDHELFGRKWIADNPKAVILFVHGMMEHSGRYIDYCDVLCENGFNIYIYDQAGHGRSVTDYPGEALGFFDKKNGWNRLISDLEQVSKFVKEENKELPMYIYGHSMGSFITRSFMYRHGNEFDGFILSGTMGPGRVFKSAEFMADTLCKIGRTKDPSKFLLLLSVGSYANKYKNESKLAWLTRDKESYISYKKDPLCGFIFTTSGYKDLFSGLARVSSRDWYKKLPNKPMLFISGTGDPVGNYGKGVPELIKKLEKTGHNKITMKLYENYRHELHNEIDKEVPINDVIQWLNNQAKEING